MSDRHTQKPYPLRIPDELRQRLEAAAAKSGRSLNAEIVHTLEMALEPGTQQGLEGLSRALRIVGDQEGYEIRIAIVKEGESLPTRKPAVKHEKKK